MAVFAGVVVAAAAGGAVFLPQAAPALGATATSIAVEAMSIGVTDAIKEKANIFWSGTPSLDGKHADVWGTIWSPQVGSGGWL